MTTLNVKAQLMAADFNVRESSFDSAFTAARASIDDQQKRIQEAMYSGMYYFISDFTINNMVRLFKGLSCDEQGIINQTRYDDMRSWVINFFVEAKKQGLMKGCPLMVTSFDDVKTGMTTIIVDWNKDAEGGRKYNLPDRNNAATAGDNAKLLALLDEFANSVNVTGCKISIEKAIKAENQKKRDEAAAAMNPAQAQAKAIMDRAKALSTAKSTLTSAVNKAVEKFRDNGGTEEELKTHLRNLIATIHFQLEQVEANSEEPATEDGEAVA